MSIKQVAQMAGVSVSTAARVLRNPNHKCSSEETRQKILQAAREIHYVPNAAAVSLKSGCKEEKEIYRIDILITRINAEDNDPFFSEILRATEIEIRKNGCTVDKIWFREDFSSESDCKDEDIDMITDNLYKEKDNKGNGGLIIIGKCCPKALKAIKNHEKNIVSINRNSTNFMVDEVICDGKKVALTAISQLVKLGHRKIAYVGNCHGESRFSGYEEAKIKYNLENDYDFIFDTLPTEENGFAAMEYFLKIKNHPTGIYCANDILAVGMLKCLNKKRNRLYYPSIISSDNIAEAQYTKPMLTTVALPKDEMVRLGVMLLIDRIKGGHKSTARLELEGTLVIRESCVSLNQSYEPEYYI